MDYSILMVEDLIERALGEDIGTGDITVNGIVSADAVTEAVIHAKEAGTIVGVQVAKAVFERLSPLVEFTAYKKDGEKVEKGDVVARVSGSARAILTGERLALNLLQRLSGVATKTARLVDILAYYNTKIVDTRKTTPGLRALEKYAVRMGGGHNHRFGLYDGVLIKDNHIKVAGGIQRAVALARQNAPHTLKIEVEVESLEGVQEALGAQADIIMLDNMDLESMKQAVQLVAGRALVEASGGMDETNILEVAKTGVDLISVGAITHSATALDISLDIGEIKVQV